MSNVNSTDRISPESSVEDLNDLNDSNDSSQSSFFSDENNVNMNDSVAAGSSNDEAVDYIEEEEASMEESVELTDGFEDDEDRRVFNDMPFGYKIIQLKHNMAEDFLYSYHYYRTDLSQKRIGSFLAKATNLNKLTLDMGPDGGEREIPNVLRGPFQQHSLKELQIFGTATTALQTEDMLCIGNYLRKSSSVNCIKFYGSRIGIDGMEALAEALDEAQPLKIDLDNILSERGAVSSSFRHCFAKKLTRLELSGSWIRMEDLEAVAAILRDPMSSLQHFTVRSRNLSDDHTRTLLEALAHNTKVTSLNMWGQAFAGATWDCYERLVFNKTNINAVYESNHTLPWIHGRFLHIRGDGTLICLPEPNNPPWLRRRQKIIKFVTDGETFNMSPFLALDFNVLPHALEFVGRRCPVEHLNHGDAFFAVDTMIQIVHNVYFWRKWHE